MDSTLLEVRDLSVSYGTVSALKHINFSMQKGEVLTLLGSNGAGKSTLLKAMMRVVSWKSGDILFEGRSLKQFRTDQIVPQGLVLVPEGRGILTSMTVEENFELGGYHRPNWREKLPRIFELFPILKTRFKQNAGTLSGGEQQMLAIGRALLSEPKLLLLDEPSLGLAPKVIQSIFELIAEIQRQGMSILLVEQNAHMALKVAQRGYCMETGAITLSGSAEELSTHDGIRKAYLGG